MRFIHSLQRARYVLAILATLVVAFAGVALWVPRAYQKEDPHNPDALKKNFYAQIKKGVGAEVRFAHAKASAAEVRDSVGSANDFIRGRSNMGMSEQTKTRLEALELASLQSGSRISTTALSVALADTITERITGLSDPDIKAAAASLNPSGETVSLRADGRYRVARGEFAPEVKKFRNQLAAGDAAAAAAVRATVNAEVENSVELLSQASPEQFGRAPEEGLTPTQALVVTYSVLTDDNLADSSADLQQKILHAPKNGKGKDKANGKADAAYGPRGRLFSSPTHLIFNQNSMGRFLDRLEKGGGK
ncbi:MAG: hypothetical protein LC802_11940 [Acidobacteria bacterium]|nr:hypothetical protein [Acidobacteriota bacterium]